jgi:hypothetical protein
MRTHSKNINSISKVLFLRNTEQITIPLGQSFRRKKGHAPQKICINLNFLPMNSTYPRSIPTKFYVSKHGASLINRN